MSYEPAWLTVAREEEARGIEEVPGPDHHPRILEYHDTTALDATTDEVPWCSSFVNWCIKNCGLSLPGTQSARARSWLKWGTNLLIPAMGCIVVMKRGGQAQPGPEVIKASGHVGFFVDQPNKLKIRVLGGNQKNSVCQRDYPVGRVLLYRWPQ